MKKLKTITLCHGDNPSWVLCPGHVPQKVFNQAHINEGWSPGGGYRQKHLTYEYWIKGPAKRKGDNFYMKKSVPGKPGAKPYTVTTWD